MGRTSLAAVSAAGFPWGWVLVAGIGLVIGFIAHVGVHGPGHIHRAGCLGTVAVSVLGAVAGVLLLGRLFDISINDVFSVTLCAFIGASALVILFSNWPRRTRSEARNGT